MRDDGGTYPTLEAAVAAVQAELAKLEEMAPCCGGSGFADYAAVPCPAPDCPAVPLMQNLTEGGRP